MSDVLTPAIIGRANELDLLRDLLNRVHDGQGGALVVRGEPGIGKSTVVAALGELGRAAEFLVISATGIEAEAQFPYAGLDQLLRPLRSLTSVLPDVQRRALSSAFGSLEGPAPDPFLVAMATLTVLVEAAEERPVLVVADDVQWLDHASHEAIAFVARRLAHDRVVLVGSWREGHDGPFVRSGIREVQLGRLDDAAARELLRRNAAHLSPAAFETLLRVSEGNPLALTELPRAWQDDRPTLGGPDTTLALTARLESAFASKFLELTDRTQAVVLVAAIDDEDSLQEILAAASALGDTPLGAVDLDAATNSALLRIDGQRVTFRHPLVRSAVIQAATLPQRLAASAALAAVLPRTGHRRAWYRAQAIVGHDDEAGDDLHDAHTIALRRGAVGAAIAFLERSAQLASDERVRGHRLLVAAQHAYTLGRTEMVNRLLDAATAAELDELDTARVAWLREIFDDGTPGDPTRVFELCAAAERSADAGDEQLALNLLMGAALRSWWADTGRDARARIVGVAQTIPADDEPLRLCVVAVAEPIEMSRHVLQRLGASSMRQLGEPEALHHLGMAAHAIGDPVGAIDYLDRADAMLRDQGRLAQLSHVLTMQLLDRIEVGDWVRARTMADEAQRLARDTGQPIWDQGTMSLTAILLGITGENERAQALASEVEHPLRHKRLDDLLACVQLARGFGWISVQRYDEAFDALDRLFNPADPAFNLVERFHGLMFHTEAALHIGRIDDAIRVVTEMERVAEVSVSPTLHMHLGYCRAVLAEGLDAEACFQDVLGQDLIRWPWHRARIELEFGKWLRRQRRSTEARSPLRSALSTFELIGATSWADQARSELRAAGERPLEASRAQASPLSPQEMQIARLVAEGLSNREIGQKLFLSPRTVGSHLYRIFPKLDITSRGQLAGRLAEVNRAD
jgi:DNA-binding CsgD family transcriptional regulator